ncbi:WD-repeat protein [Cryptosporidium canis]|nr:WD-repeat protein [Cryptosporidium canis]
MKGSGNLSSLVDYSDSDPDQSEDDEVHSTKDCGCADDTSSRGPVDSDSGSDSADDDEKSLEKLRDGAGPGGESEDSQDDDEEGMNSLSNILRLRKKMGRVIGDSVVEYPIGSNVQFRSFGATSGAEETTEENKVKQVTSISVSSKGNRMVCGVISGEIEIYDFENLYENDMNPNKVICPLENHSIQNIEFNESGTLFLAACGDSVCRVFQSSGEFITGTVQGDPYVKSVKSNPGHTHMILDCKWDPENCSRFLTCSIDNTIRLFDLNSDPFGVDCYIPSSFVMKCLDKRNLNISSIQANSLCVSPHGGRVAASCTDGSIQVFSRSSSLYSETPTMIIRDAHSLDKSANIRSISDVTFVKYNQLQDTYLASRGVVDRSVKIWDLRKASSPLKCINNLASDGNERSRLVLSKCGTSIVTSSTTIKGGQSGKASGRAKSSLVSFRIDSLVNSSESNAQELITLNDQVISTFEWSHEINQIFIALNDSSIIAYYDQDLELNPSKNGVISVFGKKRRHQFQGFSNVSLEAYSIDELPEGFKETKSGEIKYIGVSSNKKSKMYAPKLPDV